MLWSAPPTAQNRRRLSAPAERQRRLQNSAYGVFQHADSVYFAAHHIPGVELFGLIHAQCHTAGGAGGDYGTGVQCHAGGKLLYYIRNIEDHALCIAVLTLFTVDIAAYVRAGRARKGVGAHYPRSDGCEAVQTFAEIPLFVLELQIAGGNII